MSDTSVTTDKQEHIEGLSLPHVLSPAQVDHLSWPDYPSVQIIFPRPLALPVGYRNANAFSYNIVIPIHLYLALCQAAILHTKIENKAHQEYNEMIVGLIFLGMYSESGKINMQERTRMEALFLHMFLLALWQEWESKTDALLSVCYTMLADKLVTREEAFTIAVEHLRENPPKSANSWRVRVDAYAKSRELPPIGQPIRKRRPL